jgi:dienelactone hydrolase
MTWNGSDERGPVAAERGFTLEVGGREVPGVYWTPVDGGETDRLVLLGHGGTTHKKVDYIVELAETFVARGIAAMAIDGPNHGDRALAAEFGGTDDERGLDDFDERWQAGGGTAAIVADWGAALDFIEADAGRKPTGWWGLSMGTMMGLPVAAADPRIKAAVLGLMGVWGPNGDDLMTLAVDVTCPLRFLMQWDDELVPRDTCLKLFDALGTRKKTMHANPGLHAAVPAFEVAASVDYLDRYVR